MRAVQLHMWIRRPTWRSIDHQRLTWASINGRRARQTEEVSASAADISSATPANSEVQAPAGEDAEIAFTDVGVAERSKSVDSSAQSRDWRSILAAGWLLGAVCLSVVVWISYAATLRRIRCRAISVEQADLARVQSLAKELGLRRTPKIWLSPEVKAQLCAAHFVRSCCSMIASFTCCRATRPTLC